jgi:transcriptional regulator with XRE-family HTH domain
MGNVDVDLIRRARQPRESERVEFCSTEEDAALAEISEGDLASTPDPRFSREALLQTAIGRAVRDWRRRHDLNGLDLAKAAGISLGMLSRIENGTVSPSLSTLQAIGSALGVPVSDLIGGYNEHSRAVFVSSHYAGLRNKVSTSLVREVSTSLPLALDAVIVKLDSEEDKQPKFEERGTFFVHCLSGEVTYAHAKKKYPMAQGDSLTFEASGPHGVAMGTRFPAKLLIVRNHVAAKPVKDGAMANARQAVANAAESLRASSRQRP